MSKGWLVLALLLALGASDALAQGRQQPQRGEYDMGERVIRTPDNSNVPADLTPRERPNYQITVDPYMHRRGVDLDPDRMPRQRRPGDHR